MRIVIQADGSPEPDGRVQLIKDSSQDDTGSKRFFLCLGCNDIIEADPGKEHVHDCDGDEPEKRLALDTD